MIGPLISAGASLIGGFLNRQAAEEQNRVAAEQAEKNRQMQIQFAKEGVRWKVDDARAAGIHPLYALGANTVSYSPVSVGGSADTSLGSSIASAGQDISRAMNATRTAEERDDAFSKTVQDLQLKRLGLENDLLASKIAQLRASSNPPIPAIGPVPAADKYEERPRLIVGGAEVDTDPATSNAEDFEKRYGEMSDWLAGPYVLWRDYMKSAGSARRRELMNPFHSDRARGPARRWWVDKLMNWEN